MSTASISRYALAALCVVLAWRVIHVNAVLYEDSGRPRLMGGIPAGTPEREALAGVLQHNPAEVAALLMLAREYERESNLDQAARAYRAAVRLAPVDREVLGAASAFFLRQGNVADSLAVLERLAENYGDVRAQVFPIFAQILASGRNATEWDALAARDPAWMGPFIVSACNIRGFDPGALVPLLARRTASGKAGAAEAGCVVDRLRGAERWDEAYQVWLNTLPRQRLADVGFIFNGSFEYAPSGYGFDWIAATQPERDVGHAVEIAPAIGAAGKKALRVTYNGKRQAGNPIAQFLALPAGRYELGGLARPAGLKSVRGAQWVVRCVSAGKPQAVLAASERFIGSSEWRRFEFELVVPASCRGQVLQLEPAGVDEGTIYLDGAIWFDDLVLRRRA